MAKRTRLFPEPIQRDYDWAFAHWGKLSNRYPNEWVAFLHHQVLAHGKALMPVLQQARRKVDGGHIPHLFVERGLHIYHAHRP